MTGTGDANMRSAIQGTRWAVLALAFAACSEKAPPAPAAPSTVGQGD